MNNNRKNYSKRALTVRYFMTRHKQFYVLYAVSPLYLCALRLPFIFRMPFAVQLDGS